MNQANRAAGAERKRKSYDTFRATRYGDGMHSTRRTLVLGLAALAVGITFVLGPSAQDAKPSAPPAPITVVLVRHAEKGADDPRDPSLSDAGKARAEKLAKMLAASGISSVFTSEYKRTQQTAAPFATAAELETEVVPAGKPDELVAKLRALAPGSKALVVGHSNTVPKLAELLGAKLSRLEKGPGGEQFPDAEYGRLVVLTVPLGPDAAASVVELSMGD